MSLTYTSYVTPCCQQSTRTSEGDPVPSKCCQECWADLTFARHQGRPIDQIVEEDYGTVEPTTRHQALLTDARVIARHLVENQEVVIRPNGRHVVDPDDDCTINWLISFDPNAERSETLLAGMGPLIFTETFDVMESLRTATLAPAITCNA